MSFSIVVAATELGRAIGYKNALPWPRIPEDMKFFRGLTSHGAVIMGRGTFESLPQRKPLPNRLNVILSRDPSYKTTADAKVANSLEAALALTKGQPTFVIGGAQVYADALKHPGCREIYMTEVPFCVYFLVS